MSVSIKPAKYEHAVVRPGAMIGRSTALVMIAVFIGLIAVPPIHQLCIELARSGRWQFLDLFEEKPTHDSLKRFEETLARESVLGGKARVLYRTIELRTLGQGNEKIVVGHDGYLFYRQEVEMAAAPGFLHRGVTRPRGTDQPRRRGDPADSIAAIVDFERQLRHRGIHLVFMPIPLKPFIYPEEVWPGYPAAAGPAWNRDREVFLSRLGASGVDVLDPTDALWRAKTQPGESESLFLKLDTHWTPRGVGVVADRLAAHLAPLLPTRGLRHYTTRRENVTGSGDLLRLLEIAPAGGLFPPQTVQVTRVLLDPPRRPGDDRAPVLLLGDSFTNIYHHAAMEWGDSAGLGEQLMVRLGQGVEIIAVNGGGATAVRESLAKKPAALDHKQLVVWACSARDLYDESVVWERVLVPEGD
jgi:alginate O-acetyltransferase complex protein AlgJ